MKVGNDYRIRDYTVVGIPTCFCFAICCGLMLGTVFNSMNLFVSIRTHRITI